MTAWPRPSPRTDFGVAAPFGGPRATAAPRARRINLFAASLGFFCFLPYPSLPVGNMSAIQIGNVLTFFASLGVLMVPWKRRPFFIYPVILAPLCLATFAVAVAGNADVSLCLKCVITWAVACLAVLATQVYGPRHAADLLTGIAAATVLHAVIGAWQFYAFSQGDFPLWRLYVNPSFLSVQNNAEIIAQYIQRPFGIFPEPSAMSASLAPWVLFWFAHRCGLVRFRFEPAPWQRTLFSAAALGGLGLIIVSRSGHAAVTLAGLLVIAFLWFVRCEASIRTYPAILLVFGVALPLALWFGGQALADRLGGKSELGNSSWEDRTNSLKIGFSLLTDGDAATAAFGLGPGISSPLIQSLAHLEAVWSISLTYVYETGLVGLLAVGWIGSFLLRTWKKMRCDLVYLTIAAVWFIGITLTTSYWQLLPLWVALGWLTVWPEICRVPEPFRSAGGRLPGSRLPVRPRSPARARRWTSRMPPQPSPTGGTP